MLKNQSNRAMVDFDRLAQKPNDNRKLDQYITELRRNYEQQRLEVEPLLQKCELLQMDRVNFLEEIEQYKASQQELMTQFKQEYQGRETLQKKVQYQEQLIAQLQRMQMPKEFHEKKCMELSESLFTMLSEYVHEFIDEYDQFQNRSDGEEDYEYLVENLLRNIEESVNMFIENLPAQSSRGGPTEEISHLKGQIEKLIKEMQLTKQENSDLSEALEADKQYKDKLISQRNTLQSQTLQLQQKIEQLQNESKQLLGQLAFYENKSQEYLQRVQEIQQESQRAIAKIEEEKEQLKGELIEITKYQRENAQLKENIEQYSQQTYQDSQTTQQRVQELQNKLLQENIKMEQKIKEHIKLEKDLKEAKGELQKLFEQNTESLRRMELIKEKRKCDKQVLEEYKEKMKGLKGDLQQQQEEQERVVSELQKQIIALQETVGTNENAQVDSNHCINIEKDLEISKNEQIIQDLTNKVNDLKENNLQFKLEINTLNETRKKDEKLMKQLQDKREFAITEIKRLTQLNDVLKQQIIDIKKVPQQKDTYSLVDNHRDPNSSYISQHSESQRVDNKKSSTSSLFKLGMSFMSGSKQPTQVQYIQSPDKLLSEKQLWNSAEELRQILEQLYKTYITTIMLSDNGYKDELLKFERQINECVKRTQDLSDGIEDLRHF